MKSGLRSDEISARHPHLHLRAQAEQNRSAKLARSEGRRRYDERPLGILDFTSGDAAVYAEVRASLERAGTRIGPLDTLIAAHAVARKLVLVSNNEREFNRVTGLQFQNWAN